MQSQITKPPPPPPSRVLAAGIQKHLEYLALGGGPGAEWNKKAL